MSEKNNAKDYPKFYYARHMKEGVAGYGNENINLSDDTIKKMMRSFEGKPVYIQHDDREEQERIETLKETAIGYVTDSFYNELDGWFWCKFMIIDDEGHEAINAKGWTVSNAYLPTQEREGGTRHNIPYDREITDGYFTHLAIVPNPRYEDAMIFTPDAYKKYQDEKRQQSNELKNSNEEMKGLKMNFFKMKKERVSTVDADTFVEIQNADGGMMEVKVEDMIKAVEERTNQEAEEKEKVNMDDMVELSNGEKMTVAELVNKYQNMCMVEDEKSNEDDSEDDEMENQTDEDEKENQDDEEDKEKQNNLKEMQNAHKGFQGQPTPPFLKMDALALGKSKY